MFTSPETREKAFVPVKNREIHVSFARFSRLVSNERSLITISLIIIIITLLRIQTHTRACTRNMSQKRMGGGWLPLTAHINYHRPWQNTGSCLILIIHTLLLRTTVRTGCSLLSLETYLRPTLIDLCVTPSPPFARPGRAGRAPNRARPIRFPT